jgi:hypothetical protein
MVWELVFLLLILKIPMFYLCGVIWYAVRAEPAPPEPLEPALVRSPRDPEPRPGWQFLRRGRPSRPRRGPDGSPQRTYRRAPLPAGWLAEGWKETAGKDGAPKGDG